MSASNTEYETTKKNFIKEHYKDKFTCDICGGKYTYFNKTTHKKSRLHQLGMKYFEEKLKNRL